MAVAVVTAVAFAWLKTFVIPEGVAEQMLINEACQKTTRLQKAKLLRLIDHEIDHNRNAFFQKNREEIVQWFRNNRMTAFLAPTLIHTLPLPPNFSGETLSRIRMVSSNYVDPLRELGDTRKWLIKKVNAEKDRVALFDRNEVSCWIRLQIIGESKNLKGVLDAVQNLKVTGDELVQLVAFSESCPHNLYLMKRT